MTVEEVLKQSGLSDEQIAAIDAKAKQGFTTVLATALSAQEKAELAQRSYKQMYDTEIAPALDDWANEKAQLEAKMKYYETLATKAKEGGFLPGDTPFSPPAAGARDGSGRFVAGANEVPGSPKFVENLRNEAGAAIGSMLDLNWKYQSLFGQPMPDSPTALIREANAQRLDPVSYAAKKYDFAAKEKAIAEQRQKDHDEAIRKEAMDAKDKEWSEKVGSNPNIRVPQESQFSTIQKAIKTGDRPDPLNMTKAEREINTHQQIRKEIAEHAVQ